MKLPTPNFREVFRDATDSAILTPRLYGRAHFILGFMRHSILETLHRYPHSQYISKITSRPVLVAVAKWPLIRNPSSPTCARVWFFDSISNLISGFLYDLGWVLSSTCSDLIGIMLDTRQLETKWWGSETPLRRNG